MGEINLFIIEALISFIVSATVIVIIKQSMHTILIDICGSESRAKFWLIYSNIMLVIAPLLTIIVFGKSHTIANADFTFYKTAFASALFGVFISLVIIGLQITKTLPKSSEK